MSKCKLLETYIVNLDQLPVVRDETSTQILCQLHPVLLNDHIPIYGLVMATVYCALARSLFVDEDQHLLIRLLVALEMEENRKKTDNITILSLQIT